MTPKPNQGHHDALMARRKKKPKSRRQELLEELIAEAGREALKDPEGLLKELTRSLVNTAMEAELSHHLGYESGERPPPEAPNRRNGKSDKTVRTGHGPVPIEVPRDRDGSFEPKLIPKHSRQFAGFDDKIVLMYARGMTVREIRGHLEEIYGVEVSPDLISRVTDAVVDELTAWQSRPLERVYLIAYLDALVIKVRDKSGVRNKSVYLVVGLLPDGSKDVLGMWIEATEGAKFWLTILSELRQRGVPWKDRKAVCADLKTVYTAESAEAAAQALDAFEERWGDRFPMVGAAWRRRWDEVTPFLAYPPEIRRAIYTTNAIEALNRQLRKVLKTRGHMPNEQAALKLLYLAIRNAKKNWGGRDRRWNTALLQFAIYFEGRIPE